MRRRLLLLAPAGLVLARCASPEPAVYTMRAVPGAAQAGGPSAVKIARPGLAGYLDRPEIVRDASANRLAVNSAERWGEPLGDLIGRVLAVDVSQRLPGSSVFTEAGSISVDADATVELDIQRFDLDVGGAVVLLAQVAVRAGRNRDTATTRSLRFSASPAGKSTSDLVTAMSGLVGQLADAIADLLRSSVPVPLARRS